MELKTPTHPVADPRRQQPTSDTPSQGPQTITAGTAEAAVNEAAELDDGLECEFCGLVMGLDEECCPRCGLTVENTASLFAAQAASPKSYQPGGLLPSEDHPMNCVACGMPVGEAVCTHCGFTPVSEDTDLSWSDLVTPALHQDSRFAVSLAMQCDEQGLKQLANALVWGEDSQRHLAPAELAAQPPKWLPEHHLPLWQSVVQEHEHTTYRDAVSTFKRQLFA